MNPTANNVAPDDQAIHRWYRFVLAYPPHLVRDYLERFQVSASQQILDPFCGTGTTLIECMRLGIRSIGIEANPVVSFASRVKTDWSPDPAGLLDHARRVADHAYDRLRRDGIEDVPLALHKSEPVADLRTLPPEQAKLLLANSISPLPLHKSLVLLESLEVLHDARYYAHERLPWPTW